LRLCLQCPLQSLQTQFWNLQNLIPSTPSEALRVTLINAATYSHASKLKGSKCFKLWISHPETTGHSAATSKAPVDMSSIPKDYHDFVDVFSKYKAGKLADHRPYNLKITLDEGTALSFGPSTSCHRRNLRLFIS